jgi:hypothetical protein
MNDSNASTEIVDNVEKPPVIPPSEVQFWTLVIFEVPSLACTIFLLYHLITDRHLRRGLHNHVIIILLVLTFFIEVFDNPLYIDAYRLGGYHNSFTMSPPICLMWWFFDNGFYGAITVFLAWGSIERHILVFHHHFLRTGRQKLFVHYLPLLLILVYIFGFYIIIIFFPPCENTYDYQQLACGLSPCYEEISYLNIWDYLVNGIMCTFIETVCSLGLLIRVLWQKRRSHQQVNWKKHRKMAFQLLSVSSMSLTVVFPQSLLRVIQSFGGESLANFGAELDAYLFYLYTFVVIFLPFICLGSLPELWPKLLPIKGKRRNQVSQVTLLAKQGPAITVKP